jgi:hypothetical protein
MRCGQAVEQDHGRSFALVEDRERDPVVLDQVVSHISHVLP